jgi:hypothetical protein
MGRPVSIRRESPALERLPSTFGRHDQAGLVRSDHRLGVVAQAALGEQAADVGLDRVLGHDEAGGDLAVGQAFG